MMVPIYKSHCETNIGRNCLKILIVVILIFFYSRVRWVLLREDYHHFILIQEINQEMKFGSITACPEKLGEIINYYIAYIRIATGITFWWMSNLFWYTWWVIIRSFPPFFPPSGHTPHIHNEWIILCQKRPSCLYKTIPNSSLPFWGCHSGQNFFVTNKNGPG